MNIEQMEEEILKIQERNKRVEIDKSWETSLFRRGIITASTFIVVYLFLLTINAPQPALSAMIPAIGYILSTLTLPFLKGWWISTQK
ncbi:MAG: hypothetical protein AABX38_04915 [Candidatus Micrarchaeota archaeon]